MTVAYISFSACYELFVPLNYEQDVFEILPINTSGLAALGAAAWGYADDLLNKKKDARVVETVADIVHRWGLAPRMERIDYSLTLASFATKIKTKARRVQEKSKTAMDDIVDKLPLIKLKQPIRRTFISEMK